MLLKERLFIGAGLLIVVGGSIVYFATKPAPTRFRRSVLPEREKLVLPTLQNISSGGDGEVDWKLRIQDTANCLWIQTLASNGKSDHNNQERKRVCSSRTTENKENNFSEEVVKK